MFCSRHFVSLVAFSLLTLSTGCKDASATGPDITTDLPQQQTMFCQVAGKGNLNDAVASLGSSGTFVAWHGTGSVRLREDGKTLAMSFSPACPDSSASITLEDQTGVSANTSFGRSLQATDFSGGMIVSGKLSISNASSLIAQLQLVSPGQFSQRSPTASTSVLASIVNGLSGQDQQKRFCQFILNERAESQHLDEQATFEQNPYKAAQIQNRKQVIFTKMFDDLYRLMAPSGNFVDWRGKVRLYPADNNQTIEISVAPDCLESMEIFNLETYTGPMAKTNILVNSSFGQTVQSLDISKGVIVSGQFLWAPGPPLKGSWSPPIDNRRHFYPVQGFFTSDHIRFVVRIDKIVSAR